VAIKISCVLVGLGEGVGVGIGVVVNARVGVSVRRGALSSEGVGEIALTGIPSGVIQVVEVGDRLTDMGEVGVASLVRGPVPLSPSK